MSEFISEEQQRIHSEQRQKRLDQLAIVIRDALNVRQWNSWGELADSKGISASDISEVVCTRLIVNQDGTAEINPQSHPQ